MDNPLLDHVMSVSSLNLFATSPAAYREHILYPTKEVTTYFTKGSAVDCLITEPDEFQNKFAVIKTTRPSGMMGDLCRLMHEYEKVNTEGLPEETLFKVAYKKTGFKLKEESVWKKYQGPAIQQYMTFLRNSQGKDVITEAITEWLPYITLQEVSVDLSPDNVDRNIYRVSLKFSLQYEPDRFDTISFNFIGAPK